MTHIKQQTFLTANSHRGHNYSFTIDLHNSPMALHANSCLKCKKIGYNIITVENIVRIQYHGMVGLGRKYPNVDLLHS
jgi:hypothetical protein